MSYKTFQRTITKLGNGGFIEKNTISGGADGSTTLVRYADVSDAGQDKDPFDDFESADKQPTLDKF